MKAERKRDELDRALAKWKEALFRFDIAEPDEAACAALEAEAAKKRYMLLLARRRRCMICS